MKKYLLILFLVCGSVAVFGQTRNRTVNIVVNVGTGELLTGQPVTLVHTDYGLTYSGVTLDADGKCTVKVYEGPHHVSVSRDGYQTAESDFTVDASNDGLTVTLDLLEKVRTPYALQAKLEHDAVTGNNQILMAWNTEPPVFFDDFEDYQDALANGAASVLPPTTEPWGQRTSYVADPDGNLIEIGSFTK